MKIIDATGSVVGRLAAKSVKEALNGGEVTIINIEEAVFSGDPKGIVALYAARRNVQNKGNPEHSPKWPRRPDLLFRKIIDGMLPKKTSRSKVALKKLRVHMGVPKELAGKPAEKMEKKLNCKTITLNQVCKSLGWSPIE